MHDLHASHNSEARVRVIRDSVASGAPCCLKGKAMSQACRHAGCTPRSARPRARALGRRGLSLGVSYVSRAAVSRSRSRLRAPGAVCPAVKCTTAWPWRRRRRPSRPNVRAPAPGCGPSSVQPAQRPADLGVGSTAVTVAVSRQRTRSSPRTTEPPRHPTRHQMHVRMQLPSGMHARCVLCLQSSVSHEKRARRAASLVLLLMGRWQYRCRRARMYRNASGIHGTAVWADCECPITSIYTPLKLTRHTHNRCGHPGQENCSASRSRALVLGRAAGGSRPSKP